MSRPLLHLGRISALALALSACAVDPYCLDCVERDAGADAFTGRDANVRFPDSGRLADIGPADGGDPADAACTPGAPELCNQLDDDCDRTIDEGIDVMTDVLNCGACGARCAPPGAFGECRQGRCEIMQCEQDYYDRDLDPGNGCELRCVRTGDEICDRRDNDCDFMTDETFDLTLDPMNCGACTRRCVRARATAVCAPTGAAPPMLPGACEIGTCDADFYDLDGVDANGCEYGCVRDPGGVELCNLRDDDCDGTIDEGDPESGDACGSDVGECSPGVEHCRNGRLACEGATTAAVEDCDGLDDDCDGNTDEGNPGGGPLCGNGRGACTQGQLTCQGGSLQCVGEVTGTAETCNNIDDDCDGTIDEGDPGSGAACGNDVGECVAGVERCRGGRIVCEGAVASSRELCDGLDNNCDGNIDEMNPGGGALCGTGVGACEPGTSTCVNGRIECVGLVGGTAETCNNTDDDCDGRIDEGNPGGGRACGNDTGECSQGMEVCRAGRLVCEGGVTPAAEVCDGLDNNCDGNTDEMNPGGGALCGTGQGACEPGRRTCMGGTLVCVGQVGPATEQCNNIDDDCDGVIDNGDPGGGAACGSSTGECNPGALRCRNGVLACVGQITSSPEQCDGLDNDCDSRTDEGNPGGGGSCGTGVGACETGNQVCMGGMLACMGGVGPVAEMCNNVDDDCDGVIDNGNPGGGAACGTDTGECSRGTLQCRNGSVSCEGQVTARAEQCNGLDDDCDTRTDEGNPGGGGICGTGVGACETGTQVCMGGMLACMGGVGPATETCNNIDDDCNGVIDNGNPGGGGACGTDTGECSRGTLQCRGGVVSCEGQVTGSAEQCDNQDDDCDGRTDEGNPGGGAACGSSVGVCRPGTQTCMGGTLQCVGATTGGAEQCNTLDDDCDGRLDEGNPQGGAACGTDTGECVAGALTCQGGTLACVGSVGPTIEVCNGRNDDCDAGTDEGFNLMTDPRNCGMCGRQCNLANAISGCGGGNCTIIACLPGFRNTDGNVLNGCEHMCDFAGAETCNGRDDDCDTRTDEGLTPPATLCNPNGVCAGTVAACSGMAGWTCTYTSMFYQADETLCDGRDNDCDGRADEPFATLGQACNNGQQGACRRTGMVVCNGTQDNVVCNAPSGSGSMSAEVCDGVDNDCDGVLDDNAPASWVQFTSGGNTRWIMQYEASRPDATAMSAGSMSHRVCSDANRLPWTQVTYPQAVAACATVGGRLCNEAEWQDACESSTQTCLWADGEAPPGCQMYSPTTCNGNEYDTTPGGADDDRVLATGSLAMCYAPWGAAANQRIFDMSGNVEEWAFRRSAGVNPVRGGSTNDTGFGLRCDSNFVVANDTFQVPTVGFRCCRDTMP